jgi:hypothetical protein
MLLSTSTANRCVLGCLCYFVGSDRFTTVDCALECSPLGGSTMLIAGVAMVGQVTLPQSFRLSFDVVGDALVSNGAVGPSLIDIRDVDGMVSLVSVQSTITRNLALSYGGVTMQDANMPLLNEDYEIVWETVVLTYTHPGYLTLSSSSNLSQVVSSDVSQSADPLPSSMLKLFATRTSSAQYGWYLRNVQVQGKVPFRRCYTFVL